MQIPKYSVQQKSVIFFFLILLILGGFMTYEKIGKLEDPDFTIKTAVIITPWPGASPHEVELQVTDIIEQAVQSTEFVDEIRSESRAGLSMVFLDIEEHKQADQIPQIWDQLRKKIQGAQGYLPDGAGPSLVQDDYGDVYGFFLALTGDGYEFTSLENYADLIRKELLAVKNVSRVQIYGTHTQAIDIEIPEDRMALQGIRPSDVVAALSMQNTVVDAGSIDSDTRRIRISTPGVFDTVETIKNLTLYASDGRSFRMGDIATVRRSYITPMEQSLRFNGKPGIGIAVSAKEGTNVVAVGDAVAMEIDKIIPTLPVGMELNGIYFQSESVQKAINQFMTNLLQSIAIVIVVLLITMGLRGGLIIASGLIFSILGTLIVMLAWGIDLQRISLAALILVMGMIVDNAIVVVDGSLQRLKQGHSKFDASVLPAVETAWPLLGATLIAALAFFPIYMAPSNTGEYCASMFQVVAIALMMSWVLAITQTPVFAHQFLKQPQARGQAENPYDGSFYRFYQHFLSFALRHRGISIVIMLVLMVSAVLGFRHVPQDFFADSDRNMFMVDVWLPDGTRIEAVSEQMAKLEDYFKTQDHIGDFTSFIGSGPVRYEASQNPEPPTTNYGHMMVHVDDYRNIPDIQKKTTAWMAVNLPDAAPRVRMYRSGPPCDFKVEARFTGPDPAVLRSLADQATDIMRLNPYAGDVRNDWGNPVPVIEVPFNQREGRAVGVERSALGQALNRRTDGQAVGIFREGDKHRPIILKTMASEEAGLEKVPVWGHGMESRPMQQVTDPIQVLWENPVIIRTDRKRAIKAQCDPVGMTGESLRQQILPAISKIPLPDGYKLNWVGDYELSVEGQESTQVFLPLTLLSMAAILVLLFGQLRPLLIIVLTLPLAVVGITFGLLTMGKAFGFLAILGAYSLLGMLIKNAIVLLDQIQLEIKNGVPPYTAVINASTSRLRPVVMAAGTTILGMIPLLTDPLFSAMAVTIMFGLLFGTVLTLVVVPIFYTVFYRVETQSAHEQA